MRLEYFQMLDAIVELTDESIRTRATVPQESTVFEGHFPGHPLMPGVLLIETMAQTCGTMVMAANGYERLPLLVGVKDAKLRQFIPPGTEIHGFGHLEHNGSGYAVVKAELKVDGKRVSNAQLTYTLIKWPEADLRDFMVDHIASLRKRGSEDAA
ncbi:3-hydroxyacyl-ACP dehydratase FabZ family protein [Tepidamorphus sp. 3E244]|uniref:3-hydroxyacyl-ACP dehydratase FabZ family protein n=1 Tax=Tepidamorphus sp. 3E244 TaxID=3385498 RepID=UPI0038FC5267